jgi:hypothetical protein
MVMQLNLCFPALTEHSARASSHLHMHDPLSSSPAIKWVGRAEGCGLANSPTLHSTFCLPTFALSQLHVQLLISISTPTFTSGDKSISKRNRSKTPTHSYFTHPTGSIARSHGATSGAGPALPLQDRQDPGRGFILGGERVCAHRYRSLLCRKSHQQAPHGRP